MARSSLEERVATLEKELAELKRPKKNWRDTVGLFTGNEEMLSLFEEAKKLRESDRAKARRQARKPRRSQS